MHWASSPTLNTLGAGLSVPFPSGPAPLFGPGEAQGSLSRLLQPARGKGLPRAPSQLLQVAKRGGQDFPPAPMPPHTRQVAWPGQLSSALALGASSPVPPPPGLALLCYSSKVQRLEGQCQLTSSHNPRASSPYCCRW